MVEHVEAFGKDTAGKGISEGQAAGRSDKAYGLRAAEGNAFSEDLNRVISGLHHLLNNHKTSTRYINHYHNITIILPPEYGFEPDKMIIELNEFEKG